MACPGPFADQATLAALDGYPEGRRVRCATLDDPEERAVVATHELDDERAHLGVLGPRGVRDVGGPQDRLACGDACAFLPDADPATALDDDEPGRVRVGVRLDRRVARERQLADRAATVGMDRLAGDPARACRTVGSPMADAEADDLDRHPDR